MKMYHCHRFILCITFSFLAVTLYLLVALYGTSRGEDDLPNKNHQIYMVSDIKPFNRLNERQIRSLLRQVESVNNERIRRIEDVCGKYNLGIFKTSEAKTVDYPPVPQYSVFYFDRENKFTYCPIYKAGSTTWLFNLCLLGGMTEEEILQSKRQLSDLVRSKYPELEPTAAEEAFQTTIKIISVRHPFERLLSAYRDKLENINFGREHGTYHFYSAYGSKIVKKYRKNGNKTKSWDLLKSSQYLWNPDHPKPAGIEPTFKEFVLYLINLNLAHYSDDHWIPYYLFCTPCLLRYDIIVKTETMDLDQLYTIHVLGLQTKIRPKWEHKTQFIENDKSEINKPSQLAKIYFRQLTIDEINKLYEKYKIDFELFGYDHSEYVKHASDYNINNINK